MFALSENWRRETFDALGGDASGEGHVGQRNARADPLLDLPGSKGGFHVDLQLSQSGSVVSDGCTQPLVGWYLDGLTGIGDHDESEAIRGETEGPRLTHVRLRLRYRRNATYPVGRHSLRTTCP